MHWRVTRFPILASTNDLALEWIAGGRAAAGDVLITAEQTSGRGRRGRSWHSPPGALLCTAVLPFRPDRGGWTALAAGIAVARAVRDLGAPAGVKWPNDVLLHGRKLAGILIEAPNMELVAVGIGVNVANPLSPETRHRAIRLADVLPGAAPEAVLAALLPRLAWAWDRLHAPDPLPLRQEWESLDTTAGRRVRWSEEGVCGTARGVDAAGALRIDTDTGRCVAATVGEVQFLDAAPEKSP